MLPTQLPGTIWFNAGDPNVGLVTASIGQLLINTDDSTFWYKDDLDSSSWTKLLGQPLGPSVEADFFDDFVSLSNWTVILNGGGTSAGLTVPEATTCGLAAVAGNIAAQFSSIDLQRDWFEIETYPILVKARANHNTTITAALDVRLELGLIKSGGAVAQDGAYFRCGNAQNGNNNWNAFRTGAAAVNTGIAVNTTYRDFEVEFDGVNWLYRIDGALVATIAAQGADSASLGFNRFQVSGLASSIMNCDYIGYRYDVTR